MSDKAPHNVLIVSNEADVTRAVCKIAASYGVRAITADGAESGLHKLTNRFWDLILADADCLDGKRHQLIQEAKRDCPETPVVVISRQKSDRAVVRAIREGADDVLIKPVDEAVLRPLLEGLLPNHRVPMAAAAEQSSHCLYRIVGRSRSLHETISTARKVAPTSVPVHLVGESGTGKELFAYLIHRNSRRWDRPYIRVNCAALSESLLESELFGHERGAFTGAYSQRKGRFERAHGGTLLLDEVSETPARLQAELLRVLEQQDFERVGGSELIRVNVRLISTSNCNLQELVQQGRFRGDLYYRLCGIRLDLPPLRKRTEDIEPLIWHFINIYAREVRRRITELDGEMVSLLRQYSWPGNVRQLRNLIRAAIVLGDGPTLSLDDCPSLEDQLREHKESSTNALSLKELERRAIFEALRRTKSHQAKAAELLGITDRTLREKLRKYRQSGCMPSGEKRWLAERT